MAEVKLKPGAVASKVYEDFVWIIRDRTGLVWALALTTLIHPLMQWFLEFVVADALVAMLVSVAAYIGILFLICPIYIAVYQSIAAGEGATPRRLAGLGSHHSERMWAWSMVFLLVSSAPSLIFVVLWSIGAIQPSSISWFATMFGALLGSFYLTARLSTLVPSAALSPESTSLKNAFNQTRGHLAAIVGAMILVTLPIIVMTTLFVLIVPMAIVFLFGPYVAAALLFIVVPVQFIGSALSLLLMIIISTHLRQTLPVPDG